MRQLPDTLTASLAQLVGHAEGMPEAINGRIALTTTRLLQSINEFEEAEGAAALIVACASVAGEAGRLSPPSSTVRFCASGRRTAYRALQLSVAWTESERRALSAALVHFAMGGGEAGQRAMRPGAKAAAAAFVCRLWPLLAADPSGMLQLNFATFLEQGVAERVERSKFADARRLLDLAPDDVRAAHYNWRDVEELLMRREREAWHSKPKDEDPYQALEEEFIAIISSSAGVGVARSYAEQGLAKLRSAREKTPDLLIEMASEAQEVLLTFGEVNSHQDTRFEQNLLRHGFESLDDDKINERITRLREISDEQVRTGFWSDAAFSETSIHEMQRHIGAKLDSYESILRAIEYAEKPLDFQSAPFAGGVIQAARVPLDHAVLALVADERFESAFHLTERHKGLLPARVREEKLPSVRDAFSGLKSAGADARSHLSVCITREATLMICRTGGCFIANTIPVGRQTLRNVMLRLRPNAWRKSGAFPPAAMGVIQHLSQLTSWLPDEMLETGIVISPDGPLHNAPWHLLKTNSGLPLVAAAAVQQVSSIPICVSLAPEVGALPTDTPKATVLCCPAADERAPAAWSSWGKRLAAEISVNGHEVKLLEEEKATPEAFVLALQTDQIVHVRSHGTFQTTSGSVDDDSAYAASGLLLSSGNGLPLRENHSMPSLTPAFVRQNLNPRLGRAHVTLEACVSGIAGEGISDAPVSLPWILELYGAQTVLASGWDVDAHAAELLCSSFYDRWLCQGQTRAESLRSATLEAIAKFGFSAAAFKLIGYAS